MHIDRSFRSRERIALYTIHSNKLLRYKNKFIKRNKSELNIILPSVETMCPHSYRNEVFHLEESTNNILIIGLHINRCKMLFQFSAMHDLKK